MEDLSEFLDAISDERYEQMRKWGDQRHPDGTSVDFKPLADMARNATQFNAAKGTVTWAHILEEEVREAFAEENPVKLKAELIQVATVCAAWVHDIDRRGK